MQKRIEAATQGWWERLNHLIVHGNHTPPLQVGESEVCHCLNCGTDFVGNYCPHCGQSSKTSRLSFVQALDNILGAVVNLDRGLVHTCIELIYRPGYMMHDYVKGHRVEYVKPIQLLFLLSTLYLILKYLLYYGSDLGVSNTITLEDPEEQAKLQWLLDLLQVIDSNHAIAALIMVVVMLLPSWLSFRGTSVGKQICLAEFFFVMVFVSCQQMLFSFLQLPLQRLSGQTPSLDIGLSFTYMVWSFHQFFLLSWRRTILRVVFTWFYSLLLLIVSIVVIAVIGAIFIALFNIDINRYVNLVTDHL